MQVAPNSVCASRAQAPRGLQARLRAPVGRGAVRVQCSSLVESSRGKNPAVEKAIEAQLDKCIKETNLSAGKKKVGKVRDTYDTGDFLVIVTTDRQSAFDRLLASVPFKGQVLNQTAEWWFKQTESFVPNALLACPHPNVAVMRKCTVFPVEFVVRGYLTGSTSTSIWTQYAKGVRNYCGEALPEGLVKNAKLPRNMLTPTTKAEDHDEPISPADIVKRGLMTQKEWDEASALALKLFSFGQEKAAKNGLLLADTKYEFGRDVADGSIRLIDEVHTPDSSRYWVASTYAQRHAEGKEPENIDKEFLRLWFKDRCDPYKDKVLPDAPPELVTELSRRYILLYETITGQAFVPPKAGLEQGPVMDAAVGECLAKLRAAAKK